MPAEGRPSETGRGRLAGQLDRFHKRAFVQRKKRGLKLQVLCSVGSCCRKVDEMNLETRGKKQLDNDGAPGGGRRAGGGGGGE